MAVSTYVVGNDGNVSLAGPGTATTTVTIMKVRSFAANLSRVSSDVTAFGDTGKRRRLGIPDLTGTLNAVAHVDSTGSTSTSTIFTETNTYALTLTLFDGTGTADAKMAANVVFNSFAFNSDKSGDATVTATFENGDGAAPVVTWLQ